MILGEWLPLILFHACGVRFALEILGLCVAYDHLTNLHFGECNWAHRESFAAVLETAGGSSFVVSARFWEFFAQLPPCVLGIAILFFCRFMKRMLVHAVFEVALASAVLCVFGCGAHSVVALVDVPAILIATLVSRDWFFPIFHLPIENLQL